MSSPFLPSAPNHDGELLLLDQLKTQKPKPYVVLLHNDDYTTMEFVLHILSKFFNKSPTEAERIMLMVHFQGRGIAGIYPRDIAETKVEQVTSYARTNGHPLQLTAEPQ